MEKSEASALGLLITLILLAQLASSQNVEPAWKAQKLSSETLSNNTFKYDGKEVIFFGELVGDIMRRGDSTWINLYDGPYAIGIFLPSEMANNSMISGDYSHKGDMIEVTGVFNRACKEHGGDMDIHATSIRRIASGYEIDHPISTSKVLFTLLVVVANIPLLIVIGRMKDATP